MVRGKKFATAVGMAFGLFFGLSNDPVGAQGKAAERQILFHLGFKAGEEGLSRWWDNGDFTVNFAGLSEERAFKGKSSFKIDITFKTGTSCYWKGPQFYIPLKGNPRVRGALYVQKGNAEKISIGYSLNAGAGDMCGSCRQVQQLPSGWIEWESNLEPTVYDMDHVERVAVYIKGAPGERVVIFLDEFEVEATPFPALSEKIKKQTQAKADVRKEESRIKLQRRLDELSEELEEIERAFSRPRPSLPATTASWLQKIDKELSEYCANKLLPLKNELERLAKKSGTDFESTLWELGQAIPNQLRYLRFGLTSYYNLPDFVKVYGDRPFLVYAISPIQNDKILPTSFPVPGAIGTALSLSACPDEYKPTSFAIYAAKELKEVKVVASKLSPSFSTPSRELFPQVDLFMVKCWWQAGQNLFNCDPDNPVLTPELLLKDPELVVVDNVKKRNTLKNPEGPQDAKILQPITIPEGTLQQYWATVYIPKNTPAGVYQGTLKVEISGAPGITLPLSVEVLPFQLEPPILEYGIFYEGFLYDESYNPNTGEPHFDSLVKTEKQYLADMMDLKAHGIDLPACEDNIMLNPDGTLDFSHFRRIWELRKKAGLTKGPIVKTRPGVPISDYAYEKDPVKKKELIKTIHERVKQWMAFVEETGFPTPLIFGIDEAGGDILLAERDAYKAVQEAGGMTGVAVAYPFLRHSGDSLNRPIIYKGTTTEDLKIIHAQGHKAWVYGNPQGGVEEPETYRRNYGLALWQGGYDGACTWAYQWPFGPSMWDDFDTNFEARDHMMTYPALDGPISTIQWEGWREGYNDVRYLTTLIKAIEIAKRSTNDTLKKVAVDAERYLETLEVEHRNLDTVRLEIIDYLLKLQSQ